MGAMAMLGIAATALTGTLTITESLSGFGNRVIWLIVIAFFISRGFIKSGLGARIAYLFMAAVGKKSLGLAYSLVATDLVLAPAIPSNTARAGGVIFPILRSVARSFGSEPDDGTARNPLAAKLAEDAGVQLTWALWAKAAIVPGLVSLIAVPWILYKLYPPETRETPGATQIARTKLTEMGRLKPSEKMMLGTFLLLLFLWIFGRELGIHSTTAALVGLAVLLVSGTLTWTDILEEKGAWDTLVWFAALVRRWALRLPAMVGPPLSFS
jgi:DASS family divalent anion:Na+ symporter